MKACTKCGERKRLKDFPRRGKHQEKRKSWCASCVSEHNKTYKAANKQAIRKQRRPYDREYMQTRRKTDPAFRLMGSLCARLRCAVKQKSSSTLKLLACSPDDFRIYLEGKFLHGMTWENYGRGGWHMDHIVPCASFDLLDPWEQEACFHYTNLQPLWEHNNIKKSNRTTGLLPQAERKVFTGYFKVRHHATQNI